MDLPKELEEREKILSTFEKVRENAVCMQKVIQERMNSMKAVQEQMGTCLDDAGILVMEGDNIIKTYFTEAKEMCETLEKDLKDLEDEILKLEDWFNDLEQKIEEAKKNVDEVKMLIQSSVTK